MSARVKRAAPSALPPGGGNLLRHCGHRAAFFGLRSWEKETPMSERCPYCDYEWEPRVRGPKRCPRCTGRLDVPTRWERRRARLVSSTPVTTAAESR